MEFRQLQSFTAVVRYGSFTKAAEKLFTSQPTVSAHVRALEEELHARLILRTTQSVEVTPKGREVYDYAVSILSLRERMRQSCAADARKVLHVGASTLPSAYILPELLPEYGRLCPDTYFVIHQGDSQAVIDGLLSGLYDVGLTGVSARRDELICEPFCEDRTVLITPVAERFLEMKAQGVAPVGDEGGNGSKAADRYLDSLGLSADSLRVVARANDPETVKNLVAKGLGISLLSARAARDFAREKRLLVFELPEYDSRRPLYLLRLKTGAMRDDVRRFAEFVIAKGREEGRED